MRNTKTQRAVGCRGWAIFLTLALAACTLLSGLLPAWAAESSTGVSEDDYSFTVGAKYDEDPTITSLTIFEDCQYILANSQGNIQFNTLSNPDWCAYYCDKDGYIIYKFKVTRPADLVDVDFDAYFSGHLQVDIYASATEENDAKVLMDKGDDIWTNIYTWTYGSLDNAKGTPGSNRIVRKNAIQLGFDGKFAEESIKAIKAAGTDERGATYLYVKICDAYPTDGYGGGIMRYGITEDGSVAVYENHVRFIYKTQARSYSFTVAANRTSTNITTLKDCPTYVLDGSTGNCDATAHFNDKDAVTVYRYCISDPKSLKNLSYTAWVKNDLKMDAWVGGWYNDVASLNTAIAAGENDGWYNLYTASSRLSVTSAETLGIPEKLRTYVCETAPEKATADNTPLYLYIRVSDSVTTDGWGGAICRKDTAGNITPTTLKLIYVTPEECKTANGGAHPDADKNCVCDVCETALEHQYVADCAKTCTVCGATRTAPAEHSFGEWSNTEDGKSHTRTCSKCGETESAAHVSASGKYSYTDNTGHYLTCDTCGLSYGKTSHKVYYYASKGEAGHSYKSCEVCGYDPNARVNPHKWHFDGMSGESYLFRCSFCGETTTVAPSAIATDKIVLCDTLTMSNIVSVTMTGNTVFRYANFTAPVDARLMRFMEFDLWIDSEALADELSGATFNVELTSSGKHDASEDCYEGSLGTLKAGWNHISIPISSFRMSDQSCAKGDGKYLQNEALNFFRVFVKSTGADVSGKVALTHVTLTADTAGNKSAELVMNGNTEKDYLKNDNSGWNDTSRNESHIRYTDGNGYYDYVYELTDPVNIRALTWTADLSNKVQVQVAVADSADLTNDAVTGWVTVFDNNDRGNHGLQVLDLYAAIGDKLTAETKYLYVKISNNPANVNQGWGGGTTWDNGYTVTLNAIYKKSTLTSLDDYEGNTGDIWTNVADETRPTSPVPNGDGVWKKTGVCVLDSAYDSGVIDVADGEVKIIGALQSHLKYMNVSVDGTIGLKFYLMLSDEVIANPAGYALRFLGADGTVLETRALSDELLKEALQGAETATPGTFMFRYALAAAEMTKSVSVQIVTADGTAEGNVSAAWTVRDYAEQMYDLTTDANTKALLRAMLKYGSAAQKYFNVSTDNLADNSTIMGGYTGSTLDEAKAGVAGYTNERKTEGDVGISAKSYRLYLQSETMMAVTFEATDTSATFTFTGENISETLPYKVEDGKYIVYLTNISAPELGNTYMIIVTNGANGTTYTFKTSVLSYMRTVFNSTNATSAELDLYVALYDYYVAAHANFN